MFDVHHVIARLEIEGIGGESRQVRFCAGRTRDQFRRFEQIFGAEDGQLGIGKDRAALDCRRE